MSENTQLAPAAQFKNQVMRFADDFVSTMVESDHEAQVLRGRYALAFREAAIKNSDLYEVPPVDVAWAIARSALTGLMPGGPTPHVDLIVRWNKKLNRKAIDWQVSSRGWQKLAEDAGHIIEAHPVFEGDSLVYRLDASKPGGVEFVLEPDPWRDPSYEDLLGFVCIARPLRGAAPPRYRMVPKRKIAELRSKADTQMVWNAWPLEMAEKAVKAYVIRRGFVPMTKATGQTVQLDAMASVAPTPTELAQAFGQEPPEARETGMGGVADAIDLAEQERAQRQAEPAPTNGAGHAAPEPEPEPEPEEVEVNQEVEEIRHLMSQLPDADRSRLMKAANDGKNIRLPKPGPRPPTKAMQRFAQLAREFIASAEDEPEEEPELPPEPEQPAEEAEEWGVEEIEAGLTQMTPSQRKTACQAAQVPCSIVGTPDWGFIEQNPGHLQALGDAVDAQLREMEA